MKKVLSFLAIAFLSSMLVCPVANARSITQWKSLSDSAGTALSAYNLTSGAAKYSEAILIKGSAGSTAVLLLTESKAGGAGDVDINAQYSLDGTNWYSAYTSNMAGTSTVEGNIVTAIGNTTQYIVHTIRAGIYMRYKFDPDADSQITAKFAIQVDQ